MAGNNYPDSPICRGMKFATQISPLLNLEWAQVHRCFNMNGLSTRLEDSHYRCFMSIQTFQFFELSIQHRMILVDVIREKNLMRIFS